MNDNQNKDVKDTVADSSKEPKEIKEPAAAENVKDAPAAEKPVAAEPAKEPEIKEPAAAENVKDAPAAEKPIAAEPAKEPEIKEPADAENVKDAPAAEKPVADEPVKEQKEADTASSSAKIDDVKNDNKSNVRVNIIASVFESAKNAQKTAESPASEDVKIAQNKDASADKSVQDETDIKGKSADTSNIKEKIIVAAVILAGAWSVFFAVFGKTPPNAVSLKNFASEVASQNGPGNASQTKKVPNKKYKKAKDFTLTDLDGKITKFSSLRGKTVFIDFWASWCPPCKMSIPAVKKLHEKMKNNPNVVILSVNCWEEKKKASNFVKKEKINYPVLFSDGIIEKDYNVSSIPRFFIIDGDGNIINEYSGWHPSYPAKWEEDIYETLSGKQGEHAAQAAPQQPPLSDLDGNAVNIADHKGKTLFLAFWVMQSYACVKAQPAFNAISNKVSKTANAEFLGINVDSQQSMLKTYVKDNNMKYPVLRATENFADSYGVSSVYPACVIIDKNGKTVKTFFGYSDGDEKEWSKAFNEAVKAK